MKPDQQPVYEDVLKFPDMKKLMEDQLEDYNMEPGVIPMGLVLFRDAIEHGKHIYHYTYKYHSLQYASVYV